MKRKISENPPRRFLFFDTETTGLPSRDRKIRRDPLTWPRLVEIGWILTDQDGVILSENATLVIPDSFVIPDESTLIHGITTEEALNYGVPLVEALHTFCQIIHDADIIVAHNLSFDMRILVSELIRMGMKNLLWDIPGICTMKSSASFCAIPGRFGKGFKWPSLKFLYKSLFHTDPHISHRALDDTLLCARCFHELQKKGILMKPEMITKKIFQK